MTRTALAILVAAGAAFALMAPSAGPPPSGPAVVQVRVVPAVGSADVAMGFEHGAGRVVTVAHVIPGRGARVRVRSSPSTKARP
ncbi:MAG TPA: hypothetical protein VE270_07520, partial [Thermoleophilaceae bacterium]|nr:hypothetical protein [Thermoleophilaceae bacterium]